MKHENLRLDTFPLVKLCSILLLSLLLFNTLQAGPCNIIKIFISRI